MGGALGPVYPLRICSFFSAVDLHRCCGDRDLIRLKEVLYLAAKISGVDWVWLALAEASVHGGAEGQGVRVCERERAPSRLWVREMELFLSFTGLHQDAKLAPGQRLAMSSHRRPRRIILHHADCAHTHLRRVCVLWYTHSFSGAQHHISSYSRRCRPQNLSTPPLWFSFRSLRHRFPLSLEGPRTNGNRSATDG